MTTLNDVLSDLDAESARLEELLAAHPPEAWRTPTPAPGWDVATQISHLAWTDEVALLAATDPAGWDAAVQAAMSDPEGFVDREALAGASADPDALLVRWQRGRPALADALTKVPAGQKVPWFGPPMSPTSMATARFMETWAHSLDVHEALDSAFEVTDRIRHVAHLGVRTRDFAFAAHGDRPPAEQFRVALVAPSGQEWIWGPASAEQRVAGPALDFCRLVTQRVHRDDTALVGSGPAAERWLRIAQCFAGPPGPGREPRG